MHRLICAAASIAITAGMIAFGAAAEGPTIVVAQAPGQPPMMPMGPMHHGAGGPPPMLHGQPGMMECPMMQGQSGMGGCPMMKGMHGGVRVPYGGNQEAANAYAQAMMKMHQDMDIAYSGNPDRDFAAGMIPHHQGAIDTAKIVIQYGKDPEIKKLAQEIIATQEKEIALLKAWLAKQPQ